MRHSIRYDLQFESRCLFSKMKTIKPNERCKHNDYIILYSQFNCINTSFVKN